MMPLLSASAKPSRTPSALSSGFENSAEHAAVREIAGLRIVARHVARDGSPHVPVGLDEAGQRDHRRSIDDSRTSRFERRPDRNNLAVADVNVAARKLAELRIHRHDIGIADKKLAARGKALRKSSTGRRLRARIIRAEECSADGGSRQYFAPRDAKSVADTAHGFLPFFSSIRRLCDAFPPEKDYPPFPVRNGTASR